MIWDILGTSNTVKTSRMFYHVCSAAESDNVLWSSPRGPLWQCATQNTLIDHNEIVVESRFATHCMHMRRGGKLWTYSTFILLKSQTYRIFKPNDLKRVFGINRLHSVWHIVNNIIININFMHRIKRIVENQHRDQCTRYKYIIFL